MMYNTFDTSFSMIPYVQCLLHVSLLNITYMIQDFILRIRVAVNYEADTGKIHISNLVVAHLQPLEVNILWDLWSLAILHQLSLWEFFCGISSEATTSPPQVHILLLYTNHHQILSSIYTERLNTFVMTEYKYQFCYLTCRIS